MSIPHQFCSVNLPPRCCQVPDVWWWPWPAVTALLTSSCPFRNKEERPDISSRSSTPSVSLWLGLGSCWFQQARRKGVDPTSPPKQNTYPPWRSIWCESVDIVWMDFFSFFFWWNGGTPSRIDTVSAFICMRAFCTSENVLKTVPELGICVMKMRGVLAPRRQVWEIEKGSRKHVFSFCVFITAHYFCV